MTTSRKQPPPISDQPSKTLNFSQSSPYHWNLSLTATSCKRAGPLFGAGSFIIFYCFSPFLTDRFTHGGLMFCLFCVLCSLECTKTARNYTCNKLSNHQGDTTDMYGSLLRRDSLWFDCCKRPPSVSHR